MVIQPSYLVNDIVELVPLKQSDFEELYAVASDPLIWEQHPNPDRYKKEVFEVYFKGAIDSKGAFLIKNAKSGEVIGCTRFYDYNAEDKSILIGYTFFARSCWGKGINHAVKRLMLHYAFSYVDKVIFHVGALNKRSQIAMERLGAIKTGEVKVAYFGEATKLNFVYTIVKDKFITN
jgi:RimJ/RimL family protein N-acetyltransferase